MTRQQEILRDKLKYGGDVFKRIESLRSYMTENEKIQEGMHDLQLRQLIDEQNGVLNAEYKRLINIRRKIDQCIMTVEDDELRALLTMRYLGHRNTIEIAEKLHYGRNTVNRKHKAALNKILESGSDKILDY